MSGVAYWVLQRTIVADEGVDSALRRALGRDWKGKASLVLYVVGVALAFPAPSVAELLYAAVAVMWLIPDRRMERAIDGA